MTVRVVFYATASVLVLFLIGIMLPSGYNSPSRVSLIHVSRVTMWDLASSMDDYRASFGAYPTGDNPTILKALLGANATRTFYFQAHTRWINTNGVYVDPWQTPYEIRVITTNTIFIRSAGKNRRFGDKDDVTLDFKGAEFRSPDPGR